MSYNCNPQPNKSVIYAVAPLHPPVNLNRAPCLLVNFHRKFLGLVEQRQEPFHTSPLQSFHITHLDVYDSVSEPRLSVSAGRCYIGYIFVVRDGGVVRRMTEIGLSSPLSDTVSGFGGPITCVPLLAVIRTISRQDSRPELRLELRLSRYLQF